MNKPKLLLIGYRAYGDWVYAAPVLPLLFERYDIYADVNIKGWELFHDDPRFKHLSIFPFEQVKPEDLPKVFMERLVKVRDEVKPDKIIDLNGTLEVECIPERFQREFHLPVAERQQIYKHKTFYDATFKRCELEVPAEPNLDGFHWSSDEVAVVERWRQRHSGQFVVMFPIAGSRFHKMYFDGERLTRLILEKYPDSVVYLVGDDYTKDFMWSHERIWKIYQAPIKQVFLMTKYADFVFGPETGVMAAAGMFHTPKTIVCTASGIEQITKYQRNDFSIQAPLPCSPCHRALHYDADCETVVREEGKEPYAACVASVPAEQILKVVDHVYSNLRSKIPSAVR